ncbi:sensor histidine kinase [Sulfitobacter guttiformis]|uniref:histidine kinase n=1 Tax=Sulfitobacter guttiformis TaxID=74349 RepID=A0A420DRM4_9RHOB|nr:HAMP domain-containing sensor histidine kinase [Sulfitobacter guttiformis]KIN74223.1 Two-component hybrid sensor and regulator [Sulfitobacter guttiformis KCTC 32187]RKE96830.1 phospho-acceptor domain-containing protein [Sulfitobacter guttiformis]
MNFIKRPIRTTLLVLFIVAAALSGGVLWALNEHLRKVVVVEQGDPLWVTSQLQHEFLRLKESINLYGDGELTGSNVALRFDIAWSRINIMQLGAMAAFSSALPEEENPIASLEETFRSIEHAIQALQVSENSLTERAQNAKLLQDSLQPYDPRLKRFALLLAQEKSRSMYEYRSNALSLAGAIGYLLAAILLLTTAFCGFLVLDLRESRATTLKLEDLANRASAASAAKDRFMSAISHELRTPLTSIRGAIGILINTFDAMPAAQAKKVIAIAERNSERLLTLVNDILDAQQVMEGKVKLRLELIDLSHIIWAAVEDCQAYADQMHVTYKVEIQDEPLMVEADKDRISQVICNLLSNAAKFSNSGDEVTVRAFKSGNLVKVEVEDHGVGIAEEEHESIFTRFHQINPGETGPNKSSGLGLNISKELIEMHGGNISFSSSLATGAIFRFSLTAKG